MRMPRPADDNQSQLCWTRQTQIPEICLHFMVGCLSCERYAPEQLREGDAGKGPRERGSCFLLGSILGAFACQKLLRHLWAWSLGGIGRPIKPSLVTRLFSVSPRLGLQWTPHNGKSLQPGSQCP